MTRRGFGGRDGGRAAEQGARADRRDLPARRRQAAAGRVGAASSAWPVAVPANPPSSPSRGRSFGRKVARFLDRMRAPGGGDAEFHPGRLVIDDAPRSPIRGKVGATIFAILLAALAWSYFGRLASYTSAAGKIQAVGRTKVLEALASGKVVKIRAVDGDTVAANQVLVELDPTDALAQRTIVDQKLTDLRAETLRLRTEIDAARAPVIDPATKVPWGKEVPAPVRTREDGVAQADLAKLGQQIATLVAQKHAKEAERDKFAKSLAAQKALVAVTQENLAMIETLMKSGYNSQAKYLDMKAQLDGQQVMQTSFEGSLENAKQAILVIDSEMAKTREVFVTQATQKVSTNEQAIVDLAQQLVKAQQVLSNMTLRAPVGGVVHASNVTTIGQVVKASQQLMQIVPSDAPLEIQAYVSNTDIGFIRKGDAAVIKVSAFSYKTYGWIEGSVTEVANDALALQGKPTIQSSSLDGEYTSTTAAQKTGNLQFPVTVRASRSTMTVDGKEIPLVPGMGVDVEILTENRRAIDYILSPLEELFSTAGHERS